MQVTYTKWNLHTFGMTTAQIESIDKQSDLNILLIETVNLLLGID